MLPVPLNIAIMLTGYLLVMGYLAVGLLLQRRVTPPDRITAERTGRVTGRGWLRLLRHLAGTAVGGYLLLMAVVLAYYWGVAGLGGAFLASAVTGAALLIGIAVPVFLLVSWLVERRR